MNSVASEFFDVFSSFRKLRVSALFPEGISHGEYEILRMIERCQKNADGDGVTVSAVGKRIHMIAPAVSRYLRTLEDKQLIERSVNKNDRRNIYLTITPKGSAMIAEVTAAMDDFSEAVFARMGDENMARLTSYLKDLEKTCEEEIEKRKDSKREQAEKNSRKSKGKA